MSVRASASVCVCARVCVHAHAFMRASGAATHHSLPIQYSPFVLGVIKRNVAGIDIAWRLQFSMKKRYEWMVKVQVFAAFLLLVSNNKALYFRLLLVLFLWTFLGLWQQTSDVDHDEHDLGEYVILCVE